MIDPFLDRALAQALGIPPSATLELMRRILGVPTTDPPPQSRND